MNNFMVGFVGSVTGVVLYVLPAYVLSSLVGWSTTCLIAAIVGTMLGFMWKDEIENL